MRFETPGAFLLFFLLPVILFGGRRIINLLFRRETQPLTASGILFSIPLGRDYLDAVTRERSLRTKFGLPFLRLLRTAAFGLIVVALARPQYGNSFREVQWSGRDVLLALDISGSMMAIDFTVEGRRTDRITALKHVVKQFIDKREGDRMALVVFGDEVFTQCPLTLDRSALKTFVESLEVGMAGKGTAIGDGLAVSLRRLKEIKAKSKVIILVTDGKNNAGNLAPLEAAKIAKELGIKIYTVGIGGEGDAPFPLQGPFGIKTIVRQKMEFDEETLRQIAATTGGVYFNAQNTASLEKVYAEIDMLEERVEKTFQYTSYEEQSGPFILGALLLFVLAEFLSGTVLVRIP